MIFQATRRIINLKHDLIVGKIDGALEWRDFCWYIKRHLGATVDSIENSLRERAASTLNGVLQYCCRLCAYKLVRPHSS
jgi:hypothetical protein